MNKKNKRITDLRALVPAGVLSITYLPLYSEVKLHAELDMIRLENEENKKNNPDPNKPGGTPAAVRLAA